MFQDISLSKDMNERFKMNVSGSGDPLNRKFFLHDPMPSGCGHVGVVTSFFYILTVDFSIMVLSSGSWPFTQGPVFSLPAEVRVYVHTYTRDRSFMDM